MYDIIFHTRTDSFEGRIEGQVFPTPAHFFAEASANPDKVLTIRVNPKNVLQDGKRMGYPPGYTATRYIPFKMIESMTIISKPED